MLISVGETQSVLSAGFSGLLSLKHATSKNGSIPGIKSLRQQEGKKAIKTNVGHFFFYECKFPYALLCKAGLK